MTRSKFLQFISEYIDSKGEWPKIPYLSMHFGLPQYKISQMLSHLCETGDLVRYGSWYRFPSEVEKQEFIKNEMEAKPDEEIVIPVETSKSSISSEVLSWIIFSIGAGASIMSAYYTQIYLSESLNTFFSWFFSIIMVVFSVVVFSIVALMLSGSVIKSKLRFLLVGFCLFLWLLTAGYSIVSTIAGQYNQRAKNEVEEVAIKNEAVVDTTLIQLEVSSRNDLIAQRDEARKRLEGLFIASEQALKNPEASPESWTSIQSRILSTQATISALDKKITESRDREKKMLEDNPLASTKTKKSSSFFEWIVSMFGGSQDMVQFWLSIFPAIFLDIISPVSLTIFIFMRRKNREDKPII
jgi:hypothetical protein